MASVRFRDLPARVPGKLDCFMFDPRKILVDPDYNCRDMNSVETVDHVAWLADEIESQGYNPEMPLTVKRRGDDIVLIRGHCRLAACMNLIAKDFELVGVPVMQIASGTNEIDLIFDQESSNNGLRLDKLAKARLCLKARKAGVTHEEIARRMHWKSVESVKEHLELLETPEALKQDIRDGVMSAGTALQLHRDHGEAAPEVARKAKAAAPTTGKKKGRVTQATVAKVTGKSSRTKTNEHFIDFVAVANKMEDAVKLAGGLDKVAPEKISALVSETITTLARSKGRHVAAKPPAEVKEEQQPLPDLPRVGEYVADYSLPTDAEFKSPPPIDASLPHEQEEVANGEMADRGNAVAHDGQADIEMNNLSVGYRPTSVAPRFVDSTLGNSPRKDIKDLIDSLLPFARMAEITNLDELADDYLHEVSNRDIKRAAAAWFKATGETTTGNGVAGGEEIAA